MQLKIETITPARAKELLDMNTENFRPIDKRRVTIYAKEMEMGNWDLNAETIKINGSTLIDGQHRLAAIIKANVPIQTVVAYGVNSSGRSVDRGKTRSIGAWLNHSGIKNATNAGAAARWCVFYRKGMWGKFNIQHEDVIDSEIFEFIESNAELLEECVKLSGHSKKVVPQSLLAAVLFIGCEHVSLSHEVAQWFVASLAAGENLMATDAVFHLRNRMLSQSQAKKISSPLVRAFLTIAWNKTVLGESCSASTLRLRLSGPGAQSMPDKIEVLTSAVV